MNYWYSPSTGGFYPVNRKGKGKPVDAVLVTAAEHAALFPADQPHREIESGPDGKPRWRTYGPTERRRDTLFAIKSEAARRIDAIMPLYKQLNAIRCGEDISPEFARIDALRAASNAIEESLSANSALAPVDISNHPLWPEFD